MRFLVVILLSMFVGSASAQTYRPFPVDNGVWTYQSSDEWGNHLATGSFTLTGDTTINSLTYKKIQYAGGSIREVGKIIYFVPDTSSTGAEYVLYDFNLNLGDTVTDFYGGHDCESDTIIVHTVDSVLGSNGWHRRLRMGNYVTWIEGIGSVHNFTAPFSVGCLSGSVDLVCMWSDTSFVYPTDPCIVGIEELPSTSINIHPNPTQDWITVSLEEAKTGVLRVLNSLGQVVLEDDFKGVTELSLSLDGPSGLYFLQLEVDGQVITKKVVKE